MHLRNCALLIGQSNNASDFCIIQGPPGTGKTETIGNIVKHLVDCGLKVFVTAPTHTAINNCLNAVASYPSYQLHLCQDLAHFCMNS
jgi:MinD superfamily P-loop ATPase